jgi:hypothetical protein
MLACCYEAVEAFHTHTYIYIYIYMTMIEYIMYIYIYVCVVKEYMKMRRLDKIELRRSISILDGT